MDDTIRQTILNRMVHGQSYESQEALREAARKLAFDCYCRLYTADEHALIATVPDGWLPMSDCIQVTFGNIPEADVRLYFSGALSKDDNIAPIRYKFAWRDMGVHRLKLDLKDELVERFLDLRERYMRLMHTTVMSQEEIRGCLCCVDTVAELVERWPQFRPYVAGLDGTPILRLVSNDSH